MSEYESCKCPVCGASHKKRLPPKDSFTLAEPWSWVKELEKFLFANMINPSGKTPDANFLAKEYAANNSSAVGYIAVGMKKGCKYEAFKSGAHFYFINQGDVKKIDGVELDQAMEDCKQGKSDMPKFVSSPTQEGRG